MTSAGGLFAADIEAAAAIGTLEGATAQQKNPHAAGSLPWLSWIVARLGGWNCYYKPPGPKTMARGFDRLAARIEGFTLAGTSTCVNTVAARVREKNSKLPNRTDCRRARLPTFDTVRRVAFTPQQMYALVADVERYPEFLPLCEALSVLSRSTADDKPVIVAAMEIGYKAIRERFTTRVVLAPGEPSVFVTYLDGPFHHLENRWRFLPADGGRACDVAFWIDYQFKSPMLGLLMGAMFDKAFRKFSQAFEVRARVVYGAPGTSAPPSLSSA